MNPLAEYIESQDPFTVRSTNVYGNCWFVGAVYTDKEHARSAARYAKSEHDKAVQATRCTRPPEGWTCNLPREHNGPCAAYRKSTQCGWVDQFGNLFPMGAYNPAKATFHDADKKSWRAVYAEAA